MNSVLPREWEEEQHILRSLVDQQRQNYRRLQTLQQHESEPDVHCIRSLFSFKTYFHGVIVSFNKCLCRYGSTLSTCYRKKIG
jgi:hypothetical protein